MKPELIVLISIIAPFLCYKIVRRLRIKDKKHIEKETQRNIEITLSKLKCVRKKISSSTFYEFSCLLSDTLRLYVRSAYKIPTMRITSDEIIKRLMSNVSNDWHVISMLAEVIKITDSVKYSRKTLSVPQQRGIYKTACRFILSSERARRLKQKNAKSRDS